MGVARKHRGYPGGNSPQQSKIDEAPKNRIGIKSHARSFRWVRVCKRRHDKRYNLLSGGLAPVGR